MTFFGGGVEEEQRLLDEREHLYRDCADLELDGTQPPETIADQVIAQAREAQSGEAE